MQRQVVQLGLSAIATTVLASSAWAAATPWTPNTSGNVGAAPTGSLCLTCSLQR